MDIKKLVIATMAFFGNYVYPVFLFPFCVLEQLPTNMLFERKSTLLPFLLV